ncbi:MAG: GxxExxY protein [Candidatus Acidiferrales bacterium]
MTEKILAAAFKVQNTLGCGFLEKVYENAMVVELAQNGLAVRQQQFFKVKYEGVTIGDYLADLVVENKIIVECKAVSGLDSVHEAQLLNYLKATGLRVGLLLNFARPRVQFKRLIV